ncbi:23S rRNA (adenine(2030)-N(6))-methyltransferase RlmJ [Methylomonas sp. MED-D]|uniref:Ribosomal RNA large subunit methyltransferase J n=1 Tax=Methylomonas koyamae TaxID=702114 RepID=A0A177N3S3_9GAMM|nr:MULTISPECIES: 23S rRNA (adenine(2030)-N(6))-methyltransferase RlmJ [Methylomonas]NJA04250.1 23S rRNA (adenine(2030)-N(6))-methyltransferase RlmJ [Methylococcaceae bacterium WWC4]OAI12133.1 rRNA methyltransferase [Methylomonas koyamae]OHX35468.1 23S rRNA (adenine(2030)-N(6))-methyltransferase RlmJ [Methylomonas sp. LWB]WGS85625.1 23S rRNA (adenine(2030)-N(6))-methyltransferase RlmJ [Methylomonas sp. UP202]
MLSYRHGFHAGNFADVLKHSLLSLAIAALKQKVKPFVYIDTHAGAGKYALKSEFAQKTGEYREGIARLWDEKQPLPLLRDYLAAVRAENTGNRLARYPGSPQLVRRLVRSQDRLSLSELHTSDFQVLQQLYAGDNQVTVAKEDGLRMLGKKLPPIQKRALILIDPSYELKSEYQAVVQALAAAYHRFAGGVYALWYPVIDRDATERFMRLLVATGIPKQLRIEHCVAADTAGRGMTGAGMVFFNPPWQLDRQAEELLPWLDGVLAAGRGQWRVDWQVPETVASAADRN